MNRQKFSAIAHRDHDYCNPIAAAKVERLLDLLPLDEGSRVLDLGCGRAELGLRIIERFGSTVVAVGDGDEDGARHARPTYQKRANRHHLLSGESGEAILTLRRILRTLACASTAMISV